MGGDSKCQEGNNFQDGACNGDSLPSSTAISKICQPSAGCATGIVVSKWGEVSSKALNVA